jgi:hypothetical protein
MAQLFPEIEAPRPLQRCAETSVLPEGAALFVIEDVTGAGKTEAALVLAHRLVVAGRGQGLYFALPTMATANAMYDRLGEAYGRLFAADARPSLVLAHGRRALNPRFADRILEPVADASESTDEDAANQPAGAQRAAWIADDRRKAFLAQVGVGTLDQALLAVLPTRHAMLRLLGLTQRVLVVDEAHAYDAYMGEELKRLLQFHAALGGSAIVLSATLTARHRADLAASFSTGLQLTADKRDAPTAYPLATAVSRRQRPTACRLRRTLRAASPSSGWRTWTWPRLPWPRRRRRVPRSSGCATRWTMRSWPSSCFAPAGSTRCCFMPASPWATGSIVSARCCTASVSTRRQQTGAVACWSRPRWSSSRSISTST